MTELPNSFNWNLHKQIYTLVVKDFRDTRNKIPYVNLHGKIIECGERAGFLHHDLIIWDQNEQRSLVLLGYPSVFYVNQNHSYLVVLRKPK